MQIARSGPDTICLYLREGRDYPRANQILIKLGAAIEEPIHLPSRWVLFTVGIFVVVFVAYVASNWAPR